MAGVVKAGADYDKQALAVKRVVILKSNKKNLIIKMVCKYENIEYPHKSK